MRGKELGERYPELAAREGLALAGNRLTGAIPAALDRLAKLRALNLSANRLEGALPLLRLEVEHACRETGDVAPRRLGKFGKRLHEETALASVPQLRVAASCMQRAADAGEQSNRSWTHKPPFWDVHFAEQDAKRAAAKE